MKINRQVFQDILEKAILCTAKEGLFSDAFLFENETINAYNFEVAIMISLPFSFYKEKFAVKAINLYKLVKKIPDENIEIILEKDSKLIIKTNHIEASLQLLKDDFFHELKELSVNEWIDLSEDFYIGLKMSLMDNNNFLYPGVCGKDGKLYSLDGKKCSIYDTKKDIDYFLISNENIKKILRIFPGKIINCYNGKSWLIFKNYHITFACKKIIDDIFKTDACENLFKRYALWDSDIQGDFPENYKDTIDRSSLLTDEEYISLRFSNDFIECITKKAKNEYYEKVKWKHKMNKTFEQFQISTNYKNILYGLKRASSFYLKDSESINKIEEEREMNPKVKKIGKRIIFFADNYKLIIVCYEKE